MTNTLRPRCPFENDIVRPHERVILFCGQWCPRSRKVRRGPRAEPPKTIAADCFNEEEILATADIVDVRSFEQPILVRIREGNDRLTHAVREVLDGRLRAIEVTVVVAGKEMAVRRVTDDPHIDPVSVTDVVRDDLGRAVVEVRGGSPALGIVDVGVGGVSCIAVLVDEVPEFLRGKVEDFGGGAVACSYWGLVEISEGGGIGLGEVGEAEVDKAVAVGSGRTGKDVVFVVMEDDGGIFDGSYTGPRLGFDERAAGTPCEVRWQRGSASSVASW